MLTSVTVHSNNCMARLCSRFQLSEPPPPTFFLARVDTNFYTLQRTVASHVPSLPPKAALGESRDIQKRFSL
jgi:hypothetical protein